MSVEDCLPPALREPSTTIEGQWAFGLVMLKESLAL
jgi:hypothetical protein